MRTNDPHMNDRCCIESDTHTRNKQNQFTEYLHVVFVSMPQHLHTYGARMTLISRMEREKNEAKCITCTTYNMQLFTFN